MRIYNTALKLARFIHIMLRKNVLNSRQCRIILEFWRRPEVIGHYKKTSTSIISGKIYWLLPGI